MKLSKEVCLSIVVCSSALHAAVLPVAAAPQAVTSGRTQSLPQQESKYLQDVEAAEKQPGAGDAKLVAALTKLADFYRVIGKGDKAIPLLERALKIERENHGTSRAALVERLASEFYRTKQYAKSEPLLVEWLNDLDKQYSPDKRVRPFEPAVRVLVYLGDTSLALNDTAKAGKYLERARFISEKSDLSGGSMPYSMEFLKAYIDYLSKSGQKAEIAEWQQRLTTAINHRERQCFACGRG